MKFSLTLIFVFFFSLSLFSETKKDFYIGEYVGDPVKSTELYKEFWTKRGREITEEMLKKFVKSTSGRKFTITDKEIIFDNTIMKEHFSYKIIKIEKDVVNFEILKSKTFYYESGKTFPKTEYDKPNKFSVIFLDAKMTFLMYEFNGAKGYRACKRK